MIQKSFLNNLLSTYDVEIIEKHLFFYFLEDKKVCYKKSNILTNYFSDFILNYSLYDMVNSLKIKTIKNLENYLELLIPLQDRKISGAFFTPDYIVGYIINELKPKNNFLCLDPSCGCGAFLIGLLNYYRKKYKKKIVSILRENIFGADILDYNIRRAKILLTVYGLEYNEIVKEEDLNLVHIDSLRANWEKLNIRGFDLNFDIVLGNPPYVKFQDLSDENRDFLIKRWSSISSGTFNLYFAFFELGYELLKKDGALGYITPNNYFTSLAGESLRKFFQEKKCVYKIVDFSCKKVFDAQTYTAITFLNKFENEKIDYDRIEQEKSIISFLKKINPSSNSINNLNIKKWRLLKSDEQKNIEMIDNIGTPLKNLFDIRVGIATLKDDLYFIDKRQVNGNYYYKFLDDKRYKIEKSIVRNIFKISDFKNQNELQENSRGIIFPYKIINETAIPIEEKELKKEYTECYSYFLSVKEMLTSRGKGKENLIPFYSYGRTQGLTKKGVKLLTPTFSKEPRFMITEDEIAFFCNGYGLYIKQEGLQESLFDNFTNPLMKKENLFLVQKILNSYIMEYYIAKTSVSIEGGYPCYQKNFIEKFSIPFFSDSEIERLGLLNDKNEINKFLIEKYQLNFPIPNL